MQPYYTILHNCYITLTMLSAVVSRHIKKAFITLCSDTLESPKFQEIKDLATIDALRDIKLSLLCLFGTSFEYMRARTRLL